ncbi:MAG: 5'/3'-nucleotidase SurE [Phycisphaerales bacterium]|nr:MAG: 5'/3'-nucleotidase SurE [Phycisphaerales bacterium]
MSRRCRYLMGLTVTGILLSVSCVARGESPHDTWLKRVLITNDDGIEEEKLMPLVEAFARVAETCAIVPSQDRSGGSTYMSLGKYKDTLGAELVLEREQSSDSERVLVYAVDGFTADCVVLGLMGIMRDNPPDLVVSGINGGPNLSHEWLGSGTVGGARMAAFCGVPAIAVSGLESDQAESVAVATRWVVQLAQSRIVQNLEPGQYLTVSLPRKLPSEIRGVRVAPRAPLLGAPFFERGKKNKDPKTGRKREAWTMHFLKEANPAPADSDVALYGSDYIVIVPMAVDEHDYDLLADLQKRLREFPSWPPAANSH